MIPVERHERILALVAERGVVSIVELAKGMGVSHMTIRRDVRELEKQGNLLLVSGGVRSVRFTERLTAEPSHLVKTLMSSSEKNLIGIAASRHIPPDSCIYLDAGTTTLALARQLVGRDDLLIVTNDFAIANLLIDESRCRMIHTGGSLCRENRSCVGEAAAHALRNLSVDIAFISASSWNSRGLFTPNEDKVAVKRAATDISGKRVLLSDSSKYDTIATYMAMPISVFDVVVTDPNLPAAAQSELNKKGIELVIAGG
ncbi:DeoR/GlpR family DNA-binding transcription regulator [Acerihabitans sp. KWT182]|uniref:DeoR/GlpR family DNA-binding transcription regulator n=1 Tax=Acerihabitans sp. KWT182 TaxID=3157919 RepID=A0AAU7QAR8_9GAMM